MARSCIGIEPTGQLLGTPETTPIDSAPKPPGLVGINNRKVTSSRWRRKPRFR